MKNDKHRTLLKRIKQGITVVVALIVVAAAARPVFSFFYYDASYVKSFQRALRDANRVRLLKGGHDADRQTVLVDCRDATEVRKWIASVDVDTKKSGSHCLCFGGPVFAFYRDDEKILSLGLHHGRSLRWHQGRWKGDAFLTPASSEAIVNGLAAQGIIEPRLELNARIDPLEARTQRQKLWEAAMPETLRPLWNETRKTGATHSDAWQETVQQANAVLTAAIPDPLERIRILLAWDGGYGGKWTLHTRTSDDFFGETLPNDRRVHGASRTPARRDGTQKIGDK